MTFEETSPAMLEGQSIEIDCRDGVKLGGHLWSNPKAPLYGSVIINPATGVLARYYHRYARFLAVHGFEVLTYDYRGIGLSRLEKLRGSGYLWRHWGERDFEAAIRFMDKRRCGPLIVVGHSIGGFLPGLAQNASKIDRMLTVGAQYAWWGDYAVRRRLSLFMKWHVAMPMLTALYGYFPGRMLGWLEDLPAGVANEWSFRGIRFERSHPRVERGIALSRMSSVTASILAVAISDDDIGTVSAIRRTLDYYTGCQRTMVLIKPEDYDCESIGHFNLFHDNHADRFWRDTLLWIRDGVNPWPHNVIAR